MQCQFSADHILTVLSSPADTKILPLEPNRMALIESLWKGALESSTKVAAEPALHSKVHIFK